MIAKSRTRQVSHLRNADRPSVEPPTPMELRRQVRQRFAAAGRSQNVRSVPSGKRVRGMHRSSTQRT